MLVENRFGLGAVHPAVAAVYFALVIAIGLMVNNPAFQLIGVAGATALLVCLEGARALRFVGFALLLAVVVAAVNPLFNAHGETVLLYWWGSRPYTLEALAAGAVTGGMLAQTLLWFACVSLVLTADKLMLLFGRWAPSLMLVLTLALRLVTTLRCKVTNVANARACVGLGGGGSACADERGRWIGLHGRARCLLRRVREGALVLGSVTAAAFEDGVTTADSMTSRGFGLKGRSQYRLVRFRVPDAALLAVSVVLGASVLGALATGTLAVEFFPALRFAPMGLSSFAACFAYGLLLALPLTLHGWEVIRWRSIASSI